MPRQCVASPREYPQAPKMASDSNAIFLTENDILSASLLGRKPQELKDSELKFRQKYRGDMGKGLNMWIWFKILFCSVMTVSQWERPA